MTGGPRRRRFIRASRDHAALSWDRVAVKLVCLAGGVNAAIHPGRVLDLSTPGDAGRWWWCVTLIVGSLVGLVGLLRGSIALQRIGLPLCAAPWLGYGIALIFLSETGVTVGWGCVGLAVSLLGRWYGMSNRAITRRLTRFAQGTLRRDMGRLSG